MNPKSQYSGVKYEVPAGGHTQWKVQIKVGSRTLSVFYSNDELASAWVSDFCRYMLFGLDLAKWPYNAKQPNFAPCNPPEGVNRTWLIEKLARNKIVSQPLFDRRLREYDHWTQVVAEKQA